MITILRRENGLILWNIHGESWWAPDGDTQTAMFVAEQQARVYDPPEFPILEGMVVIDCGANVGTFSKQALRAGASVIAIEPVLELVKALVRNMNGTDKVGFNIEAKAAWYRSNDTIRMCITDVMSGFNSAVIPGHENRTIMVQTLAIDDLALAKVDMIKMDIEGAEMPALIGAEKTIKKFKPRLVISTEHLAIDRICIPYLIKSMVPEYQAYDLDSKGLPGQAMCFEVKK